MKDKILNYYNQKEMKPYIGLEHGDLYTEQVGNTFYILRKTEEKRLLKTINKTETILYIVMCCGVHEQTIIDILKSYGFDAEDLER